MSWLDKHWFGFMIVVLLFAFLFGVLLSGCAGIFYVRIGPQSIKKVTIILEEQEADPNIPKGLVSVGLIPL